ncbi:MAG: hypothetical protein NPIRA02_08300 [Nitrospirales bacterium]|nr:MAG: hypothetical protein NPIRA02_08300 [Nitrospirales bacterium]
MHHGNTTIENTLSFTWKGFMEMEQMREKMTSTLTCSPYKPALAHEWFRHFWLGVLLLSGIRSFADAEA